MLWNKENALLKKYGLKYDDFAEDDCRNLFDLYEYAAYDIAKNYIAPVKLGQFMRDLNDHHKLSDKVYRNVEQLCKLMDIEDEFTLIEWLNQD